MDVLQQVPYQASPQPMTFQADPYAYQQQQFAQAYGQQAQMQQQMQQMQGTPARVSVSVVGVGFQYHLTEDDLERVFARYGRVMSVNVNEDGASGTIVFSNMQEAAVAMQDLNGKMLNGTKGCLQVGWAPAETQTTMNQFTTYQQSHSFDGQTQNTTFVEQNGADSEANRKLTCRFDIGIENDSEFQVARRIIGTKGSNMKRIVQTTGAKLRLRGQGSGYLEGSSQQESPEPLHLCISCKDYEGYKNAVQFAEDLLTQVYHDYAKYAREKGLPVPKLRINMREQETGGNNYQNNSSFDGYSQSPKKQQTNRNPKALANGQNAANPGQREEGRNYPSDMEILQMIEDRNIARRAGNFQQADDIRENLRVQGIALVDEPGARGKSTQVTTWGYA